MSRFRRAAAAFAAGSLGAAALVALGPAAVPAFAATTTFSYTGGEQTYTVPSGVTGVSVVAYGAQGGGTGGLGGRTSASITVTPGQVLRVYRGIYNNAEPFRAEGDRRGEP